MKEEKKNLTMAIKHVRFEKDKNWRNLIQFKSILLSELERLSNKSEDELTKKDLLNLVKVNCDYMKALNLYNYWRDEMISLLAQKNGDNEDGNTRD